MIVSSNMFFYLFALILQVVIAFTKYYKFGIIFVIVSCIAFLMMRDELTYNLALTQFIEYFILLVICEIKRNITRKKKLNEIEKMKIKDL